MCPTLLQQKQMHIGSLLFSDSPYSSQPLLTTECPPKTRAEEVPSQCMQPPSFLPKLIRFNPSPHSLQYRPSLFPQQENWRWPLNVASKCQLMLTGCTGRVFPKASWMAKPRHRHGKAGFWGQISARSGGLAVGFTRKPQFPWPDFYCIGMSCLLLKQWRGVLYPSWLLGVNQGLKLLSEILKSTDLTLRYIGLTNDRRAWVILTIALKARNHFQVKDLDTHMQRNLLHHLPR